MNNYASYNSTGNKQSEKNYENLEPSRKKIPKKTCNIQNYWYNIGCIRRNKKGWI